MFQKWQYITTERDFMQYEELMKEAPKYAAIIGIGLLVAIITVNILINKLVQKIKGRIRDTRTQPTRRHGARSRD